MRDEVFINTIQSLTIHQKNILKKIHRFIEKDNKEEQILLYWRCQKW